MAKERKSYITDQSAIEYDQALRNAWNSVKSNNQTANTGNYYQNARSDASSMNSYLSDSAKEYRDSLADSFGGYNDALNAATKEYEDSVAEYYTAIRENSKKEADRRKSLGSSERKLDGQANDYADAVSAGDTYFTGNDLLDYTTGSNMTLDNIVADRTSYLTNANKKEYLHEARVGENIGDMSASQDVDTALSKLNVSRSAMTLDAAMSAYNSLTDEQAKAFQDAGGKKAVGRMNAADAVIKKYESGQGGVTEEQYNQALGYREDAYDQYISAWESAANAIDDDTMKSQIESIRRAAIQLKVDDRQNDVYYGQSQYVIDNPGEETLSHLNTLRAQMYVLNSYTYGFNRDYEIDEVLDKHMEGASYDKDAVLDWWHNLSEEDYSKLKDNSDNIERRLDEMISYNNTYSNKAFVISNMTDEEFDEFYAEYGDDIANYQKLSSRLESVTRSYQDAMARSDNMAFQMFFNWANETQAEMDALKAEMDEKYDGLSDEYVQKVITDRIRGGELEEESNSDEDKEAYSKLGGASKFIPEMNGASDNALNKLNNFGKGLDCTLDELRAYSDEELAEMVVESSDGDVSNGHFDINSPQELIRLMTDDEYGTFTFYIGKGDTSKAQEYFTSIENQLKQRRSEKKGNAWADFVEKNPAMGVTSNMVMQGGAAAIVGIASTAEQILNGGTDPYSSFSDASRLNTYTNQGFAKNIQKSFGCSEETASIAAGTITSILNNGFQTLTFRSSVFQGLSEAETVGALASIANNVSKSMPLAVMTANVFTENTQQKIAEGESVLSAFAYGALTGAVECITENIGLDAWSESVSGNVGGLLGGIANAIGIDVKSLASVPAVQAAITGSLGFASGVLSEGAEELVAEIADWIIDMAIYKEDSEFIQNLTSYFNQYKMNKTLWEDGNGNTTIANDQQLYRLATQSAFKDFAKQCWQSFYGGAISGGVFQVAGIGHIISSQTQIGKAVNDAGQTLEVIQGYLNHSGSNTELHHKAQAAMDLWNKNGKVSDVVMQDLIVAASEYASSKDAAIRDVMAMLNADGDSEGAINELTASLANGGVFETTGEDGTIQYVTYSGIGYDNATAVNDVVSGLMGNDSSVTNAQIRKSITGQTDVVAYLNNVLGSSMETGTPTEVRTAVSRYNDIYAELTQKNAGIIETNKKVRELRVQAQHEQRLAELSEVESEYDAMAESARVESSIGNETGDAEMDAESSQRASAIMQEISGEADRILQESGENSSGSGATVDGDDSEPTPQKHRATIAFSEFDIDVRNSKWGKGKGRRAIASAHSRVENIVNEKGAAVMALGDGDYVVFHADGDEVISTHHTAETVRDSLNQYLIANGIQASSSDMNDAIDKIRVGRPMSIDEVCSLSDAIAAAQVVEDRKIEREKAGVKGELERQLMSEWQQEEERQLDEKGKVTYSEEHKNLIAEAMANQFKGFFTKEYGIKDILVLYNYGKNGENGEFNYENGVVILNGNITAKTRYRFTKSGYVAQSLSAAQNISFVLGHEVLHKAIGRSVDERDTHAIETVNRVLAAYQKAYGLSDEKMELEITRREKTYTDYYQKLNPNKRVHAIRLAARQEFACDAMGWVFADLNLAKQMTAKAPGLMTDMKVAIKKFRGALAKFNGDIDTRKAVIIADGVASDFGKIIDEALMDVQSVEVDPDWNRSPIESTTDPHFDWEYDAAIAEASSTVQDISDKINELEDTMDLEKLRIDDAKASGEEYSTEAYENAVQAIKDARAELKDAKAKVKELRKAKKNKANIPGATEMRIGQMFRDARDSSRMSVDGADESIAGEVIEENRNNYIETPNGDPVAMRTTDGTMRFNVQTYEDCKAYMNEWLEEQLKPISKELESHKKKISSAERKLNSAEKKYLEAKQALRAQEEKVSSGKAKESTLEVKTRKLNEAKELFDTRKAELDAAHKEHDGAITSLESEIEATRAEIKEIQDTMEIVYNATVLLKDKKDNDGNLLFPEFSRWSEAKVEVDEQGVPVYSIVKANSEYKMNIDYSLVCKKRRALDAVLNYMVKNGIINDYSFGQEEIVIMNNIIGNIGYMLSDGTQIDGFDFEVACALCFVDAKRYRQASMADMFVSLYNKYVGSLIPSGKDYGVDYFNYGQSSAIEAKRINNGIDTMSDDDLSWDTIFDTVADNLTLSVIGKNYDKDDGMFDFIGCIDKQMKKAEQDYAKDHRKSPLMTSEARAEAMREASKMAQEILSKAIPDDRLTTINAMLGLKPGFASGTTVEQVRDYIREQLGYSETENNKPKFQEFVDAVRNNSKASGVRFTAPSSVPYKIATTLLTEPSARKYADRGDFIATDGFFQVKSQNGSMISLYNAKKGTGGPKSAETDAVFDGQILRGSSYFSHYLNDFDENGNPIKSKKGKKKTYDGPNTQTNFEAEAAYAVGGVRAQSFSDFIARMTFDYCQMFSEFAAKKLPGHSYTKEALYVQMFGKTGMKINMSLIFAVNDEVGPGGMVAPAGLQFAKDSNGNFIINEDGTPQMEYCFARESFANEGHDDYAYGFKIAKALQSAEGYKENVGTIAVATSQLHMDMLMADPNIKMVIPYHASGINPIVAQKLKIGAFTDFTSFQNTRHANAIAPVIRFANGETAGTILTQEIRDRLLADDSLYCSDKNGSLVKFDGNRLSDGFDGSKHKTLWDWYLHDRAGAGKNVSGGGEFNYNLFLHENKNEDARSGAVAYVNYCNENGYIPKFAENCLLQNEDGTWYVPEGSNYFKVIEDFNMYDNDGGYHPQRGVRWNSSVISNLIQFDNDGNVSNNSAALVDLLEEGLALEQATADARADAIGTDTQAGKMIEAIKTALQDHRDNMGDDYNPMEFDYDFDDEESDDSRKSLDVDNVDENNANEVATVAMDNLRFNLNDDGTFDVITTFSGAETVGQGFVGLFTHIAACEYDHRLAFIGRLNNGGVDNLGSVLDWADSHYLRQFRGKCDYFHASPVCHDYSDMKREAQITEEDKAMDMAFAKATATNIEDVNAPIVTIENAASYLESEEWQVIKAKLDEMGYKVVPNVYQAAEYGCPTRRERMIVYAVKQNSGYSIPEIPKPTGKHPGWYAAITGAEGSGYEGDLLPTLNEITNEPDWLITRAKRSKIDFSKVTEPMFVLGGTPEARLNFSYASDGIGPALVARGKDARLLMPNGDGTYKWYQISSRAYARMLGLPDTFKFPEAVKVNKETGLEQKKKNGDTWYTGGTMEWDFDEKHNLVQRRYARENNITVVGNGMSPAVTHAVVKPLYDMLMEKENSRQSVGDGSSATDSEIDNLVELGNDAALTELGTIQSGERFSLEETDPVKLRELWEQFDGEGIEANVYKAASPEEQARMRKEYGYIIVYRSMQEHDGKYYSPMAGKIKGKWEGGIELSYEIPANIHDLTIEKASENWDIAYKDTVPADKRSGYPKMVLWDTDTGERYMTYVDDEGAKYRLTDKDLPDTPSNRTYSWMFDLDKGNGKTVPARFNPYMHASNLALNDQFSSAYDRPNLVTVMCYVPMSEMTSGYWAEEKDGRGVKAKNGVGWQNWKAGGVAAEIAKMGGPVRDLCLSRWLLPVRIMTDAEVAKTYADLIAGTDISVPDNVVTPTLYTELKKLGVKMTKSFDKSVGDSIISKYKKADAAFDKFKKRYAKVFGSEYTGSTPSMDGISGASKNDMKFLKGKVSEYASLVSDGDNSSDFYEYGPNDFSENYESVKEKAFSEFRKKYASIFGKEYSGSIPSMDGISGIGEKNEKYLAARVKKYNSAVSDNSVASRYYGRSDARYSIDTDSMDTDYLAAVESGDMETAQRMVDRAAESKGYVTAAYHGTIPELAGFTVFDGGAFANGHALSWFTPDKSYADIYADGSGETYNVYLDLGNTLDFGSIDDTIYNTDGTYSDTMQRLSDAVGVSCDDLVQLMKTGSSRYYDGIENPEIYMITGADGFDTILKNAGYDSITAMENGVRSYGIVDSSQIKSADAITYDDAGEIIPLSERFDTAEKDIRYSISENASAEDLSQLEDDVTYALNINSDKQAFVDEILSEDPNEQKTMETRNSLIPGVNVGDRVGLVQTGRKGETVLRRLGKWEKGARPLMGYATVTEIVPMTEDNFDSYSNEHRITDKNSKFYIKPGKTKYGYRLSDIKRLDSPVATFNDANHSTPGRDITTPDIRYSVDSDSISATVDRLAEEIPYEIEKSWIVNQLKFLKQGYDRGMVGDWEIEEVLYNAINNAKMKMVRDGKVPKEDFAKYLKTDPSEYEPYVSIIKEMLDPTGTSSHTSNDATEMNDAGKRSRRASKKAKSTQAEADKASKSGDVETAAKLNEQAMQERNDAEAERITAQTDEETILEQSTQTPKTDEQILENNRQNDAEQKANAEEDPYTSGKSFDQMSGKQQMQILYDALISASKNGTSGKSRKISKAYSNTWTNSPIFQIVMENLGHIENAEDDIAGYEVKPEVKSMTIAANRLQNDPHGVIYWMNKLENQGIWEAEDLDTAMMILADMQDEAVYTGNVEDCIEWMKEIRKRATSGGQFIQAFAKYTRTAQDIAIRSIESLETQHIDGDAESEGSQRVRDEISKTKLNVQSVDAEINRLDEQYKLLIEKLARLGEAAARNDSLKEKIRSIKEDIESSKGEIDGAEKNERKLNEGVAKNAVMKAGLTAKQRELLMEVSKQMAALNRKQKYAAQLARLNKALRSAVEDLTNNTASADDIIKYLKEENSALRNLVGKAFTDVATHNDVMLIMNQYGTIAGAKKGIRASKASSIVKRQLEELEHMMTVCMSSARKANLERQIIEYAAIIDKTVKAANEAKTEDELDTAKNDLVDLIVKINSLRGFKTNNADIEGLRNAKFSYLNQFAQTDLANVADDYRSRSTANKISTWQYIAQLCNLRTWMRNLTSNMAFYALDSFSMNVASLIDCSVNLLNRGADQRTVGRSYFKTGHKYADILSDEFQYGSTIKAGMQRAGTAYREVKFDVNVGNEYNDKYNDIPVKVNANDSSNYRRTFKMAQADIAHTLDRVLSRIEGVNGVALNVSDEFFKGMIYQQCINSAANLVAQHQLTQEQARTWATEMMLYRTFQDTTKIGELLSDAHDGLNRFIGVGDDGRGNHEFGLGDVVVKYRTVPGALVTRAVEYSPIGYFHAIRQIVKFAESGGTDANAQRAFALETARATTGTGIAAFFAWLALHGLIKRDEDENDKDIQAQNRAQGFTGTMMNLSAIGRALNGESSDWQDGDELIDIGFMDPISSTITFGTVLAQRIKNSGFNNFSEFINSGALPIATNTIGAATSASLAAFMDLSMMDTVQDIMYSALYSDSDLNAAMDVIVSIASSAITGMQPSILRQIAQASDPYYRDSYSTRGDLQDALGNGQSALPQGAVDILQSLWNKTAVNIPGKANRGSVPIKTDNYGNPKTYGTSTAMSIFNAMINPGKNVRYQESEVLAEIRGIYEETGQTNVYMDRKFDKTITASWTDAEGSSISFNKNLTAEEMEQCKIAAGDYAQRFVAELMKDDEYRTADSATKADMLNDANNYAVYLAKQDFIANAGGGEYHSNNYKKMDSLMGITDSYAVSRNIINAVSENGINSIIEADSTGFLADVGSESIRMKVLSDLDGYTDSEKLSMYRVLTGSETNPDKVSDLMDAGLTFADAADVYTNYSYIKNTQTEDDSLNEQTHWDLWVNNQSQFSADEKSAILDKYKYWNMTPQQTAKYTDTLTNSGMSSSEAETYVTKLKDIEKSFGDDTSETVVNNAKIDYIINSKLSDTVKADMVSETVGSSSIFNRLSSTTAKVLMDNASKTGDYTMLNIKSADGISYNGSSVALSDDSVEAYAKAYASSIDSMVNVNWSGTYTNKDGKATSVAGKYKEIAAAYAAAAAMESEGITINDDNVSSNSALAMYVKLNGASSHGINAVTMMQMWMDIQEIRYKVSDGETNAVRSYISGKGYSGDTAQWIISNLYNSGTKFVK